MAFKLTALSHAFPPSFWSGDFANALKNLLVSLGEKRGWETKFFGVSSPQDEAGGDDFPILSGLRGRGDSVVRAARELSGNFSKVSALLAESSANSDAFVVGDVNGLTAAEWLPAFSSAANIVPWIVSDWPRRFPECDPVWVEMNKGKFPMRLIISALVKRAYDMAIPERRKLDVVRRAVFASDTLRKRNAASFTNLTDSVVIPPPIDESVFSFKETKPVRHRTWGWSGDVETDAYGLRLALRVFIFRVLQDPDSVFLLDADMYSAEGHAILKEINAHPALAPRVQLLGKVPRDRRAQDFLHRVGTLIYTRGNTGEFPILLAQAVMCGCFPLAALDEETSSLLENDSLMLFNGSAPSSAFLVCDRIVLLNEKDRAEVLAPHVERIAMQCSRGRIETAFSEFLEKSI